MPDCFGNIRKRFVCTAACRPNSDNTRADEKDKSLLFLAPSSVLPPIHLNLESVDCKNKKNDSYQ